jgi:DNA-binding response OmpR family regulator
MKRRILLVDDDLAILLTLKAVLELHEFEVDTASTSAEAFNRLQSGVYQMVISDLRMETEEAGLEVLRTARRQLYNPATALLTAYPPAGNCGVQDNWRSHSDSVLIKPLGTKEFLRQVESILARHAERSYSDDADSIRKKAFPKAQGGKRHAR